MYDPWIGPDYRPGGLLILGESAYSEDIGGGRVDPDRNHSMWSVERHLEDGVWNWSRFFNMISRALCGTESPEREAVAKAWRGIALTNYVPIAPEEVGPRSRPSPRHWAMAKSEWPRIIQTVQPSTVAVLGLDTWDHMPDTQYRIDRLRQGYSFDGRVVHCNAMHHPSGGLSWQKLRAALDELENRRPLFEAFRQMDQAG